MINGIHHTAISTGRFDEMVAFYRDVVGFEVVFHGGWKVGTDLVDKIIGLKGSSARSAILRAGNTFLEFFEYSAPTPKPADPNRLPSDHGYTHICLDVTDIDAEYARLIAGGMTFNAEPQTFSAGVRAVYGRDIDGNIIEIQEIIPGGSFVPLTLPTTGTAK